MAEAMSKGNGPRADSVGANGGAPNATPDQPRRTASIALSVAVLGVVYGDIGTSPIYALRECFAGKHPLPITPDNVLGILSLMFWTLLLVVSLKYMVFVLQADNRGEGARSRCWRCCGRTATATGIGADAKP